MRKSITILTALVMAIVLSASMLTASAADEETAVAGDKVSVTASAGHQFFYNGLSNYCWASFMDVVLSEHNGAAVSSTKKYNAWCASYGEAVPSKSQQYLLFDGEVDSNGNYYYVDENLSKNGVKGLKIPFSWALSVIKSAERLAVANGHAKADSSGAITLLEAYRFAVEVAVRCISDEVNVNTVNVISGYGSTAGENRLNAVGWDVPDFYKAVKDIYNGAVSQPFVYVPPKNVLAKKTLIKNEYVGDYLILEKFELNVSGTTVTKGSGCSAGVELLQSGRTVTLRIHKNNISPEQTVRWNITASYTKGEIYNMLFGVPIDSNGRPLDTPQNIMIYDSKPFTGSIEWKGDYMTQDEKANVTVNKKNSNGNALKGVSFTLYPVKSDGSLNTSMAETKSSDSAGKISWIDKELGTYFLVENTPTGWVAISPDAWKVTGARSAVYTTIGGKSGWKLDLLPGDCNASITAVNGKEPSIQLYKMDSDALYYLPDITFKLFSVANNKLTANLGEFTTSDNGYINFGSLPVGQYLVEEKTNIAWRPYKPESWEITGATASKYTTIGGHTGWLITANADDEITITAFNQPISEMAVFKIDESGNYLVGVEFTLEVSYNNGKTFTVLDVQTTDSEGFVLFSNLHSMLTYRITETKAPNGYSLSTQPVFVGKPDGGSHSCTVSNSPLITMPMTGSKAQMCILGVSMPVAMFGLLLIMQTIKLKTTKGEIQ